MNQQRRKNIAKAVETVSGLEERMSALLADVESAREIVNTAAEEESEYHENMPDGLKNGDKGSAAEAAVQSLEDARDALQELEDALSQTDLSDITSKLEEAAS